jgi:hypothetical protein
MGQTTFLKARIDLEANNYQVNGRFKREALG